LQESAGIQASPKRIVVAPIALAAIALFPFCGQTVLLLLVSKLAETLDSSRKFYERGDSQRAVTICGRC